MVNLKKYVLSGLASGLLAASYIGAVVSSPKYVAEKHTGYSGGKQIESSGFYWCSAVVLDSGDKAIYAHCRPTEETETIKKMIELAKKQNMDLSNSFAVINAGLKSSMNIFSNGFAEKGIEVKLANMEFAQEKDNRAPRKVSYSPIENRLDLIRGSQRASFQIK